MNRRILYILIGSLLILALILGLWFWFFSATPSSTSNSNLFNSSGDKTGSTGTDSTNTGNGQAPVGTNANAGTNSGSYGSVSDNGGVNGETSIYQGQGPSGATYDESGNATQAPPPGVDWNTGTQTGGGIGSGVVFNPTAINQVNSGTVSGSPIIGSVTGADGKQVGLGTSLGVVIGGCISQYAIDWLAVKAGNAISSLLGAAGIALQVQTSDSQTHTNGQTDTIAQCLVRTLGKMAVQAITDSTVNWINSGFDGKPAYVQDFNKFFADTADQAAGAFIQNDSNFAFLCSPFQLQVRIAVAQSYAHRNEAASCTLTDVVGNVEAFTNGDFSQGGWGGLLSFTTEPDNNPFGEYMDLQDQLGASVTVANNNATLDLNLGGGFLSVKKCNPPGSTQCVTTTPGSIVEESLKSSINANIDSLQVGDSIDEILGALQNALITKVLYSGLSSLGSNNGSSSGINDAATSQASDLMNSLQAGVSEAQQYAGIEQRTISDVEDSQQNLSDLANCWALATSTMSLSAGQIATANDGFNDATARLNQLELLVAQHNANIEAANTSIAALQELQTDLLLATVSSDVKKVQTNFTTIQATDNPHLYTATDITTAQQDRDSAQNTVAQQDTQTTAKLQQCDALSS